VQYPPPSDDDIELTDVKINGASVNNSDDGLVQLTETKINGVVQDQDDDLLAAPIKLNKFSVQNWSVNDMVGGDSHIGTVNGNKVAYYKAPASVPSPNPVTVKATIRVWIEEKIKTFSLTSKIKIIPDKFHFTYIHIDENGCYFLVDSSSCILNIKDGKVNISNIDNYKPWSDWPNCAGKDCTTTWTNKETLKGAVEITGISGSSVSSGGDLTNVNIVFAPAMGNTPSSTVQCKKGPGYSIPSAPRMADPRNINFDIDGDDVVIHFQGKTSRNELVLEAKNEKTMIYIYKIN